MSLQIFSKIVFIARLLFYSAIASAVIKYIAPHWKLLANGLTEESMNAIAFALITVPVGLYAFVLWLKRY
ncbi:hypothetical protein HCU40_03565 [Pseudanabaena biceps]|nr:hypothetical protein [Pseudanabaena biceps]